MRTRQTRSWMPLAVLFVATLVAARTAEAGDKNRIKSVSFDDQGQSTTVRIQGSATPTFTVYKLERPNRVVLDIAGAELGAAVEQAQENGQTLAVATWAINQIAAYELDDGGALVRIVVTLARPGRYDVKADGDDLVVTVVARDDAPAKADPEALAEAKDAADKAKKDSETAKAARTKAEGDAAKAREQAETSKKEAAKAKKALAEAKDAAAKAEKAGQADRERADRALAEAKAEAERTKKAAAQAKLEADRTKKSVEAAQAEAERTKKAAAQARADVERMQAEVVAAKAEAKAKGQEAADAKADAKAKGQEAADAKADAAARKQEAADARAEAERNKKEAAVAKAEADRRTKEAEEARREARQARADAEAAQRQAADKQRAAEVAQQDAADQKRAAAAAKKEAAADKRDAAAMRAEAEEMLAEAKQRAGEAAAEAKAAKKSHDAALAAQKLADKREASARQAEATAAAERKSAQAALEKAKAAGDRDADGRVAAAEERLRKAEQARTAAEDQRKQAEAVAEAARDEATRRKAETADAVAAKGAAEQERKAAQQAADEAEQRAARAEQLRKDEDQAARRAAEAKVAVEDAERAKVGKKELAAKRAEAKRLAKEAAVAKAAREREESQLAGVIAERRQAEKDLAKARTARAEAEQATKAAQREAAVARQQAEDAKREAEDAKRQAQVARDDAEEARVAAEQARDAERAAKKAATVEKAAAKKAATAERAAAAEEAALAKKDAAAAKKEAARVAKAAAKEPTKVAERPEAEPAARPAAKAVAIRDVAFQQDGDDARIIVELSGEVDTEVVRADRKSAELVLSGVSLPDKLQRKLDVSKFDGAVRAISTFADPKDATKVRVVVELTGDATPRLEKVGNTLRWHFAAAAPAVAKRKPRAKAKGKTRDIPAPVVGGYGASSAPVTSKSVAQAGGSRKKVYRGPTIDLDFKDADIHNLLRFLANIGRVSIVVPDDIKATVTVRLKRVPWDQALEVILASKGLWYRKEGSLYRIAPRKQLDAEDQAEAERIRAAVQSEAPEAEVFTLNYASAAETQDKLVPLLSPKGKIEVDSRTNSLIINDIRAHRRRIIDLASRLDTQTPQIMIEARIVEARSTYAREFGIQWGGRANASQAGGNATGLIFPNSIGIGGGAEDRNTPTGGVATPSDFAVNLPATVGTGAGGAIGLALGSVGGNFNINLRLSAAEDTGTVRIISSPKITVLNNTEASISQGVSIPISVVSAQGTQTQFVPADLSLTVTPYVSQRDCSIAMTINVTKNEPDFVNTGARGDPTILRKEANTRILVADGETTVMGGITTRNVGLAYNKVPFLGDLPVVGWFFKSRRENDDRTELLIFITPTITNKAFLRCE